MYWYSARIMWQPNIRFAYVTYTVLALSTWSCNGPDSAASALHTTPYFSLADFFSEEATKLQQSNPEIIKTVSKNSEQEEKKIQVADWRSEFALFIDADINKPAWRNSYQVDRVGSSVIYTSTDPTLRTKEIRVETSPTGTVEHIRITNQVSNMLYQTDEQLDYYVDSLYRIEKRQQVRIIGESHYTITGEWQKTLGSERP